MSQSTASSNSLSKLGSILNSDLANCNVQICLAALETDDLPSIQLMQVHQRVADDFREIVRRVFSKRSSDLDQGELVLQAYDPQTKLDDHEIEVLDLSAHKEVRVQLEALANMEDMVIFEEDAEFIERLRFYVIVFRPIKEEPILCFRSYTAKKELKRSSLYGIIFKDGQYDRMEDAIFLFDRYIDCVARGNELFILNKDKFQRIFRFYEMLIQSAEATLAVIETRIPIDDFEAFSTACKGHLLKIAKLKNIASKPYFSKITMRDIKKVIRKYNLPIATVGKGAEEKLCFDSSDKWTILRLLDDDYLESIMTGSSYEVNSKRLRE